MKVTTSKQLSNYIQDIRKQDGMSQTQVGERVGLRQATISKFEQRPDKSTLETLFKLLSALELELELKPRNNSKNPKAAENAWPEDW
ncbi:helix-turn-helix domain-containing protein [Shewanella submarina]|uniref:Helix-turn-helix domain-containing protein n=1 Tax=Shewanella submarina TaxID=2016376 RepID=A0ABV7GML7_9GAMM|nr:helix-turn-helix domain-containing protein [Shewanella submarina]MCL1039623.1 helix-turn-helix domain-containing protein [Shewanella submarina]